MYFQSVIHTPLANSKVILHNGTRYDGVPFIEKSEIAKNIFLKENSISIKLEFGKYPDREYDSKIIYGDKAILEKVMESQHL